MTNMTQLTIARCHHLFPDAHRCGSPALRGQSFCYFHHPDRKPLAARRRERTGFQLTTPTDRRALQHALNEILQRLASNRIDVRRAGLLLYSLQMASRNIP